MDSSSWRDFSIPSGTSIYGHFPSHRIVTIQHYSNDVFENAFQYAAIGMALVSPTGQWLRVNRALCGIVGYSEDELLQLTFQEITHPDDLETDLGYLQQLTHGDIEYYAMKKRY